MKILIISPGKSHDHTVVEGIEEYQKRLSKKFAVEWAFPAASNKKDEAEGILKLLKPSDFVVLFDERGKTIDTPGLAKFLEARLMDGERLVFIIGGAFGVENDVTARAQVTYKLSDLVFPHMLVRLILIEQLYRAQSILEGGKYHHA